ncbi:hypothetical protein HOD08_02145 [bacterium]|nr:hypothetical protein [bacterium]
MKKISTLILSLGLGFTNCGLHALTIPTCISDFAKTNSDNIAKAGITAPLITIGITAIVRSIIDESAAAPDKKIIGALKGLLPHHIIQGLGKTIAFDGNKKRKVMSALAWLCVAITAHNVHRQTVDSKEINLPIDVKEKISKLQKELSQLDSSAQTEEEKYIELYINASPPHKNLDDQTDEEQYNAYQRLTAVFNGHGYLKEKVLKGKQNPIKCALEINGCPSKKYCSKNLKDPYRCVFCNGNKKEEFQELLKQKNKLIKIHEQRDAIKQSLDVTKGSRNRT